MTNILVVDENLRVRESVRAGEWTGGGVGRSAGSSSAAVARSPIRLWMSDVVPTSYDAAAPCLCTRCRSMALLPTAEWEGV